MTSCVMRALVQLVSSIPLSPTIASEYLQQGSFDELNIIETSLTDKETTPVFNTLIFWYPAARTSTGEV